MKILVATQNQGKLAEIETVLRPVGIETTNPASEGLGELDVSETGETLAENALLKAQAFAAASQLPSLSDDSGLEVTALNGQPGVHSKRFAPGSDADRNRYLLSLLENASDRSAVFKTVLCLYDPATQTATYFEGVLPGVIATESRGTEGFGYDPIFVPSGYQQTLAQLGVEVKNTLSHRAQALQKVRSYLAEEK